MITRIFAAMNARLDMCSAFTGAPRAPCTIWLRWDGAVSLPPELADDPSGFARLRDSAQSRRALAGKPSPYQDRPGRQAEDRLRPCAQRAAARGKSRAESAFFAEADSKRAG